ncbi:hypothetical protein BsWGS_20402 [Bradybaena similaris]
MLDCPGGTSSHFNIAILSFLFKASTALVFISYISTGHGSFGINIHLNIVQRHGSLARSIINTRFKWYPRCLVHSASRCLVSLSRLSSHECDKTSTTELARLEPPVRQKESPISARVNAC